MQGEIEHRVHTLESNHQSFTYELRQTNITLVKIEKAIEQQNEIAVDIRLIRQEFKAYQDMEIESTKRQNARIEKLEANMSRIAWIVITSVVVALLATVIRSNK